MRLLIWSVLALVVFGFGNRMQACINDSKTLSAEQSQHPSLAEAILHPKTETPDVKELTNQIQQLHKKPDTNDPAWWNDLAGAYLRLGQPAEAVIILEPLTNRFANDYGIHANLGTAYHLLGRYTDAEKEIRRDTEINPEGHFGLEKYHLALLQYLARDEAYRTRHVYVEEFTRSFLSTPQVWAISQAEMLALRENHPTVSERKELDGEMLKILRQSTNNTLASEDARRLSWLAAQDEPPAYLDKWNLAMDPKLDNGLIYMATLNPKEPACKVMLGVVAMKHWDINLARAAFEGAIQLGSPQVPILRAQLRSLSRYHPSNFGTVLIVLAVLLLALMFTLVLVFRAFRKWWAYRSKLEKQPALQ